MFGLPGSGRYLVQGAINRDYTLVMGMILVYGVFTLLCNLIADLLYGWLDPRVRLSMSGAHASGIDRAAACSAALALAAPLVTPYSHDALDWQHLASPPQLRGFALARHGSAGPRPVRARHAGAARLAADRRARHAASACASASLGARPPGYLGGRIDARDDALRRHRLRAAVRLHRHHPVDDVSRAAASPRCSSRSARWAGSRWRASCAGRP